MYYKKGKEMIYITGDTHGPIDIHKLNKRYFDDSTLTKKDYLIMDDICSKGGTFLYAAKALKEYGAADIYLYVTHCEKTILQGEMINSGLIKKIYTTNSIYRDNYHPLIEVFNLEEM